MIPTQVTISTKSINQPSGIKPYEHYGGGFFQIYDDDQLNDFGNTLYYNLSVKQSFNFIPTPSALDIGGYAYSDLSKADYKRGYGMGMPMLPMKESPFDSFITELSTFKHQSTNYRHISFNSRSGFWLAQELNGFNNSTMDCGFICAQEEQVIEGSNLICQSAIYQTNLTAESYQWQVIRGGDLVTMQVVNNRKITLNRINANDSGLVVLELQMGSSECGEAIFRKEIWVGKPNIRVEVRNEGSYMEATVLPWSSNDADLSTQQASVVWESNPPTIPGVNPGSFSSFGAIARAYGGGLRWGVNVKVVVSNACGFVTRNFRMYSDFMNEDDEGANVILGIVPAKDPNEYEVIASIQTREGSMEDVPLVATDKVDIYVHNMAGQLIQTVKEPRVNINHLQNGAYILNAIVNDTYRAELKVYKR